jgi:hypothetical protein
MSKYTTGPWTLTEFEDHEGGNPWYRIEGDSTLFLEMVECSDGYIPGQNKANAHLIAAAPDLLEAHQSDSGPDFLDWLADRIVEVYGESPNVDFVLTLKRKAAKARAAILKATGGST